jgi:hypothetical protein
MKEGTTINNLEVGMWLTTHRQTVTSVLVRSHNDLDKRAAITLATPFRLRYSCQFKAVSEHTAAAIGNEV